MKQYVKHIEKTVEGCRLGDCPNFFCNMVQPLCSAISDEIIVEKDTEMSNTQGIRLFKAGEKAMVYRTIREEDGRPFPEWCPLSDVDEQ